MICLLNSNPRPPAQHAVTTVVHEGTKLKGNNIPMTYLTANIIYKNAIGKNQA